MTREEKKIYRMVDANYNRAKEALRVVEDVLRFSGASGTTAASWKTARHHLTAILLGFQKSPKQIVACRDIAADPGKTSYVRDRKSRRCLHDLFVSNIQRAEEALRVLEECSKAVDPKAAPLFQKMRFKIYALEKRDLAKF